MAKKDPRTTRGQLAIFITEAMRAQDLFRRIDGKVYANGKVLNIPQPEDDPDGEWIPFVKEDQEAAVIKWVDKLMADLARSLDLDAPPEPALQYISMLRNEAIATAPRTDTYLEYVRALKWDGVDRLRTFGRIIGLYVPDNVKQYVGCALADAYVENIGRMLAIGPIQRHLQSFNQDKIPVILSLGQGTGKSSTLYALACANTPDHGHHAEIKTLDENHGGRAVIKKANHKAIAEFAELDSMLRHDNKGIVKSFFEGSTATYDEKYRSDLEEVRWRAYFVGTTNDDKVLVDTENRRFACIRINKQEDVPDRSITDTESPLHLLSHPDYRDQLLAQAYYLVTTCGENVQDLATDDFITVQNAMDMESVDTLPVTDLIVRCLLEKYDEHIKDPLQAKTPCRVEWAVIKDYVHTYASGGRYAVKEIRPALKEFRAYAIQGKRYGCVFREQMWFAKTERNCAGVEIVDVEQLQTRQ